MEDRERKARTRRLQFVDTDILKGMYCWDIKSTDTHISFFICNIAPVFQKWGHTLESQNKNSACFFKADLGHNPFFNLDKASDKTFAMRQQKNRQYIILYMVDRTFGQNNTMHIGIGKTGYFWQISIGDTKMYII